MGTLASGSIDLKSLNVAGEANKYITHINDGGITVHDAINQNLNYVQIDANGMEIFKSNEAENNPSAVSVAQFGESARIGNIENPYIIITSRGLEANNASSRWFGISMDGTEETITTNYALTTTWTKSGTPSTNSLPMTITYRPSDIGDNVLATLKVTNMTAIMASNVTSISSSTGMISAYNTDARITMELNTSIIAESAANANKVDTLTIVTANGTVTAKITISETAANAQGIKTLTISASGFPNGVMAFGNISASSITYTKTQKSPSMYFGSLYGDNKSFSVSLGRGLVQTSTNQFICGQYNDDTKASVFAVGAGSETTRGDAFRVQANGTTWHKGDSSGTSATIHATAGTFVSASYSKYGKIIQLRLGFRNTNSTAAGANIFEGVFFDPIPLPAIFTLGCGYYGAHALIGQVNSDGEIVIRNASSTAFAIGSNSSAAITFTYICK